jgi:hypothetical protein
MFKFSNVAAIVCLCAASLVAGCSSEYGFSRTAFNSKFLDKTIEQGEEAAGKATSMETVDANTKVLVYAKKTFDQENANGKDASARVTFKKNAAGAFVYSGIEFIAE